MTSILKLLSDLGRRYQYLRLKRNYIKKIRKYTDEMDRRGIKVLTNEQKVEAKRFWKQFGYGLDLHWHRCYSNGPAGFDRRIVPEYIYYAVIERRLNRRDFSRAYMDKNIYDKIFPKKYLPRTYLKIENGVIFNGGLETIDTKEANRIFSSINDEVVVKKTIGSYGGKDILFLDEECRLPDGRKADSIEKVREILGNDLIIQEKVRQHDDIGRFHPSSVNTIRMITLRWDNRVREISTILRVGMDGSLLDNISQGGFAVGIDKEGNLSDVGNINMIDDFQEHPQTKEAFMGSKIPNYHLVKDMARELHGILTQFNIISWDFSVNTKKEPVFIEANIMGQGLHHHQYYNGPLFGELTEDILRL